MFESLWDQLCKCYLPISIEIAALLVQVVAEYANAEKRYLEALAYKADFFDGLCALGQLDFERAKVAMGLLVKVIRCGRHTIEAYLV